MPMSGSTYILEGSDLAQHSGHQVEVTGTLAAASSTTGGGAGSTTTAGAPGSTSSSAPGGASSTGSSASSSAQHIQVASVRMISSTCAAQ
jgi:hypothetical protein